MIRKGAIIPLVALTLPILLLLGAMAINLAHIQRVQTELDIATDVSARAASRILSSTGSEADARQAASETASRNQVDGEVMQFAPEDIVFGQSQRASQVARYDFVPGASPPNALQVNGRRTADSLNGEVKTFLPKLLGRGSMSIRSKAISTRIEVDIALVLDRSGSMAYSDTEPAAYPPAPANAPAGWDFGDPVPPHSRWLDVVDATGVFFSKVETGSQAEFISLATYSDNGQIDVDLTKTYSLITAKLNEYSNSFDSGFTNISEGLLAGADSLATTNGGRPFSAKVIVLMTDGVRTAGGNPTTVAKKLAKDGISIYTVSFSNEADQTLMKEIAKVGGGQHFHAATRQELLNVFDTIASFLPTLIVE